MSLTLMTAEPRVGSAALIVYTGTASRRVDWAVTAGTATIDPITGYTDATGRAGALLTPGATGSITVEVTAGA
jgi:hypothetical protein